MLLCAQEIVISKGTNYSPILDLPLAPLAGVFVLAFFLPLLTAPTPLLCLLVVGAGTLELWGLTNFTPLERLCVCS